MAGLVRDLLALRAGLELDQNLSAHDIELLRDINFSIRELSEPMEKGTEATYENPEQHKRTCLKCRLLNRLKNRKKNRQRKLIHILGLDFKKEIRNIYIIAHNNAQAVIARLLAFRRGFHSYDSNRAGIKRISCECNAAWQCKYESGGIPEEQKGRRQSFNCQTAS
ncbi:hypothetical protein CAPTEDRAFT_202139 [Capitella teleta]|uniref:Uncharacterized protein n=1 Tax=Capitella teleta TaxID=283909 RepID=R7U322_CAPTE|nr:hypothetical protein CAPTEDRAFT_202139 [Capitella teleta]|eukprot:ELU00745.1 hypothetical protein CAPTEDRAFT_202139 [Capitella teleta]